MNNARRENGGHFHLYFAEKASPLGEKLSAKRTDVGRVCPDSPLPGGSGKVCPHPSAGGAADTFPRGGRLPFYTSCSISSFFSGSSAAGSALKVRTPSLRYSGMALTAATVMPQT